MRHLIHDPAPVRIAVIEALGKSLDTRVKDVLFQCLAESDLERTRDKLASGASASRTAPRFRPTWW